MIIVMVISKTVCVVKYVGRNFSVFASTVAGW